MVFTFATANSVLVCRLFNTARCSLSGAGCTTVHRDQRLADRLRARGLVPAAGCAALLRFAGGQVVQRCRRQSLEGQAVQHCWSLHLVTGCTALLAAVQSNSGTGAALGCRPSALHLPAFVGLSSFVGGPDVARFLEDMWPASVVRKSIRLRQIFTASTSVGCNSCTESTMKDAGCSALLA